MTPAGRPWPAKITATLSPAFPAEVVDEEPDENLLDEPNLKPEVEEDLCPAPEVEADEPELPKLEPEVEENPEGEAPDEIPAAFPEILEPVTWNAAWPRVTPAGIPFPARTTAMSSSLCPVDPVKKEELDCLVETTFSTLDTSLELLETSKELGA